METFPATNFQSMPRSARIAKMVEAMKYQSSLPIGIPPLRRSHLSTPLREVYNPVLYPFRINTYEKQAGGGRVGLFHAVHGDAAHQLGEKIGGLLGHDFAGRRDFHYLVDVAG